MNIGTVFARAMFPVLLGTSLAGCGKSGSDSEKQQSDLAVGALSVPTSHSMSMNLDVATGGTDLDALMRLTAVKSGANHLQAMIFVSAVETNIAQFLKLPIKLLKAAESNQPTQSGTDTWIYSFDILDNNRVLTANLTAIRQSATATSWTMRVTSLPSDINGCCTDIVFFEGQSSASGSGTWEVYDITKPRDSTILFSVVYDYKSPTNKVLLVTMSGDSAQARLGRNSTVRYSANADALSLEISDSSNQGKRFLTWREANKSGEHTDPQKNRVCWDTYVNNFVDVSCE